jgi:hypothetical protein
MSHQANGQTSRSKPFGIRRDTAKILHPSSQPLACLPRVLALLALTWVLTPTAAFAQIGGVGGGWILQIIGMVQVEPGSNVLTLGIKDDVIRFAVNGIDTRDQNFSVPQFLSEARHREPSLELRGPEPLLDMLMKERPGKRVLKLTGRYYQDSRRFMLDDIDRLEDKPTLR